MKATAVVSVAAVVAVTAACTSTPTHGAYTGPRIKAPVVGEVGVAMPAPVGSSVTIDLMHLCTTGAPVRITKLTPVDPTGGIRITSWGVVPGALLIGNGGDGLPGLVDVAAGFTHRPVGDRCGRKGTGGDLWQVSVAASAKRATMRAVRVSYNGQHTDAIIGLAVCTKMAGCTAPLS